MNNLLNLIFVAVLERIGLYSFGKTAAACSLFYRPNIK